MLTEHRPGPQPPREVTAPLEIQSLLKSLQNARTPLEIRFEGRTQIFQSILVAIDPQAGTLCIDELIPSVGEKWIEQGEPFRIDGWQDGVHMRWHCASGTRVELEDGAPAFVASLPAQLTYHQRRGAFRAQVHRSIETSLELIQSGEARSHAGELLDISATGCKVRMAGNLVETLQPGRRYEQSQLQLDAEQRFSVNVEIRHRQYFEERDETHVGVHFHQPATPAQRQIDRFVTHLQREARRLAARDDLF